MVDVRAVVALGRGAVEDALQPAQVRVPDVGLDLGVRQVVESVVHGHVAVGLDHEGRRAAGAVLQPDFLVGSVDRGAPEG